MSYQEEDLKVELEDSEDFPYEEGLTDVVLLVENKRLHLNKGFLMTASPVFKTMFLGNFKEKAATEIPLPDKKYKDMMVFLKCLLQNEENELTDISVIPVMYLAWEYQTLQLVRRCENHFMMRELRQSWPIWNIDFLMEAFYLGEICNRRKLVEKALEYLRDKTHREIKRSEIYCKLDGNLSIKLLENRLSHFEK